jgi:Family of unknown function (DUF6361)
MSRFAWIDSSEKQRKQMLDAIDLFREKDTRDELGVSGIRDSFSDMLFPGTGALQTRARYFFFVPWMYLAFEAARVSSSEVARKGRAFEIKLIDQLAESSDPHGTIGIQARSALQRIPSNIYWNGLKLLGIGQFRGSQSDYHRSFNSQIAAVAAIRRNDDGEVVEHVRRTWHAGIPSAPSAFPLKVSFTLTLPEARYLKARVLENHRKSLFAFMLDRDFVDVDPGFVWDHPTSQQASGELLREIEHARCFSEVMYGAEILYNLYLGELEPRRNSVIQNCTSLLKDWIESIGERRRELLNWDREDFWKLLGQQLYLPSAGTRLFIDEWCHRVLSGNPRTLRGAESNKELIFSRETQIKGALARCNNRRSREMWKGEAGLRRLDFRWSNAHEVIRDVATSMAGGHA